MCIVYYLSVFILWCRCELCAVIIMKIEPPRLVCDARGYLNAKTAGSKIRASNQRGGPWQRIARACDDDKNSGWYVEPDFAKLMCVKNILCPCLLTRAHQLLQVEAGMPPNYSNVHIFRCFQHPNDSNYC